MRKWEEIRQFFKSIRRFLKNIPFYLPIMWDDRWYDSSYLLKIISKKCARDAKRYELDGQSQVHMTIANQLWEVADICKRLQDPDAGYPIEEPYTQQARLNAYALEQADISRLSILFTHVSNWWD